MKVHLFCIMTESVLSRLKRVTDYWLNKLRNELSPQLTYHSVDHVLDVMLCVEHIGHQELVQDEDLALVLVAALFHDSGFLLSRSNHESTSCELVKGQLPEFGFNTIEIEKICAMIMATKIPQSPSSKLAEILCDADLNYLGTEDYFSPSSRLYTELKLLNPSITELDWLDLQINFLQEHRYFTKFSKTNREPRKQLHLHQLQNERIRLLEEKAK